MTGALWEKGKGHWAEINTYRAQNDSWLWQRPWAVAAGMLWSPDPGLFQELSHSCFSIPPETIRAWAIPSSLPLHPHIFIWSVGPEHNSPQHGSCFSQTTLALSAWPRVLVIAAGLETG